MATNSHLPVRRGSGSYVEPSSPIDHTPAERRRPREEELRASEVARRARGPHTAPPAHSSESLVPERAKPIDPPRITLNGRTFAMVPRVYGDLNRLTPGNILQVKTLIGITLKYGITALCAEHRLKPEEINLNHLRVVQYVLQDGEDTPEVKVLYRKNGRGKIYETKITQDLEVTQREDRDYFGDLLTKLKEPRDGAVTTHAHEVYMKAGEILQIRTLSGKTDLPSGAATPYDLKPVKWDELSAEAKKRYPQKAAEEAEESRASSDPRKAEETGGTAERRAEELKAAKKIPHKASYERTAGPESKDLFTLSREEQELNNIPALANATSDGRADPLWWQAYLMTGILPRYVSHHHRRTRITIGDVERSVIPREYSKEDAVRLLGDLAKFKRGRTGTWYNLKGRWGFEDRIFLRRLLLLIMKEGIRGRKLVIRDGDSPEEIASLWKEFIRVELGGVIAAPTRDGGLDIPELRNNLQPHYHELEAPYKALIDNMYELIKELYKNQHFMASAGDTRDMDVL